MSEDEFEFYPCLVDGAAASIYVNLRFEQSTGGHRYTVAIAMREQGEHGIGTAEEAAALDVVEQALIDRGVELSLTYVGRIRTRGIWETVLYGADGQLAALRQVATDRAGDRRIDARSTPDPEWRYYRELLLPDAERRQWTDDRRMVQILAEQGDRLSVPRRVDHRLTFSSVEARAAFLTLAEAAGFTTVETEAPLAHVHRVDPIELDHIHEVVMLLVDAAKDGSYERWEAGIISS